MTPNINLQDIAKIAGVHPSTVSLALRDNPRISLQQRRRIQALAHQLGYQVNPLIAALMSTRRTGKSNKTVALAYVTSYPTRWGWRFPEVDRPDYFPGSAARAAELGYTLDHFWLAEPGMNPKRFSNILRSRAINGILIGRLPPGLHTINLLWENFSCVALGRTLHKPPIHRVTEDHFASAAMAVKRLTAAGYSRIGLVFSEPDDSPSVGDRWLGGYLREQLGLPPDGRLLCLTYADRDPFDAFVRWFKCWKPDCLLVTQAEPVQAWMNKLGLRTPEDVGFATLVNDHLERGWTGVHSDPYSMGVLATEMLVGLLHRTEKGIPTIPHEVLLPGQWISGNTTRGMPGNTPLKT